MLREVPLSWKLRNYGHTFHCLIASLNLSYGPLYTVPAFALHRESVASIASLKIFCQEMTV